MNGESRPKAAPESAAKTTSNMVARKRWAYALVSKCPEPPPRYGSAEWLSLADGTAEKVAAVVIAAEAWATDGDNLEEDLAIELDQRRRLDKQHEDEDYQRRHRDHRRRYAHLRLVPASVVKANIENPPKMPAPITQHAGQRGGVSDVS